jgi:hypothetical protein
MAISYPVSTPTDIGIANITLRARNAVALTESPFSFKQQVIRHAGQRWEADVSIPPVRRDLAADWKAFLVKLNGQQGTFVLSDPDYAIPRGSVRNGACRGTGVKGEDTLTVVMSGTLKAGDYINLGGYNTANAKLYMVLEDKSGSGTLKIWPNLRTTPNDEPVYVENPQGVFRLSGPVTEWSVDSTNAYGLSFSAVEVL